MINSDILEGKWKQFKGQAKQRWARLSDDEIDGIEGRVDELQGKLQEKYGYSKEQARKEIEDFEKTLH